MLKKILSSPPNLASIRAITGRILTFFAIVLVIFASSFPSAARAADPTAAQLYGTWRLEESSGLVCNLEFKKDGVFVSDVSRKGKLIGDFVGQWSLKNDTVFYTYTKSNVKQIPVGSKDQDRVVELTEEHVDLQSDKGAVKRYIRVPAK